MGDELNQFQQSNPSCPQQYRFEFLQVSSKVSEKQDQD